MWERRTDTDDPRFTVASSHLSEKILSEILEGIEFIHWQG